MPHLMYILMRSNDFVSFTLQTEREIKTICAREREIERKWEQWNKVNWCLWRVYGIMTLSLKHVTACLAPHKHTQSFFLSFYLILKHTPKYCLWMRSISGIYSEVFWYGNGMSPCYVMHCSKSINLSELQWHQYVRDIIVDLRVFVCSWIFVS